MIFFVSIRDGLRIFNDTDSVTNVRQDRLDSRKFRHDSNMISLQVHV